MDKLIKKILAKGNIKKQLLSGVTSINDLRELLYQDKPITDEQKAALENFDAIRLEILQKQPNEEAYNKQYLQFQVMSNLYDYTEFL